MNADERILAARQSLSISVSFEKEPNSFRLYWLENELFYRCDAGEPTLTAVAVGAIHSLICHNTAAILDGKDNFAISINGEMVNLPVILPPTKEPPREYPTANWRPATPPS